MTTPATRATAPIPSFHLYDTTLRDGSQQEGLTLSVADKLAVARHLDELGVTYIEGGWPGAVPRDTEFFARAADELELRGARLAAFGATRKAGVPVQEDPQVAALWTPARRPSRSSPSPICAMSPVPCAPPPRRISRWCARP